MDLKGIKMSALRKLCLLTLITLTAGSVSAQAMKKITDRLGIDSEGKACRFSIFETTNNDPRVTMFLNGAKGNFRIEFKRDEYLQGKLELLYPTGSSLSYQRGVLKYTVASTYPGEADEVVQINFRPFPFPKEETFLWPTSATATAPAESFDCEFKAPNMNTGFSMSELDLLTREAIEYELAQQNIAIDFQKGITNLQLVSPSDPNICDLEVNALAKWMENGTEQTSQCNVCFVYLNSQKTSIDWQDAACL